MIELKCKKIRGVDKKTCTAEQKIAYNLAFMCHVGNRHDICDVLKSDKAESVKCEVLHKVINFYVDIFKQEYGESEYNVDVVWVSLVRGLRGYLCGSNIVATSYEEIGKMFPLNEYKIV